ncbi:transmembrane protein 40 isoform X2 [Fukomys damarensis]|uniref:transmembrane protein 40 isoform X2 n=1 Tax=Fukomys damarensis TaxID=885580 RepID=UPI0005401C53|nr:transmembrane protein 40 isoform X2 [Fukomys damarensis]
MAPPPAVTGAACLLPCRLPAPATQLAAHLAAHLALHTGNAMETSGTSSQSQDSSLVHREAEDPPWAEAEHEAPGISKDALQLYRDGLGEVEPSGEAGLRQRGVDSTEGDAEDTQLSRLNIKKDDEFFHFVLLCFGIGALLVSYHYYADWFMSLGVGLLTFASLETVGIYFGLVYRIHSVLRGFLPLFQKFRQLGFRKTE